MLLISNPVRMAMAPCLNINATSMTEPVDGRLSDHTHQTCFSMCMFRRLCIICCVDKESTNTCHTAHNTNTCITWKVMNKSHTNIIRRCLTQSALHYPPVGAFCWIVMYAILEILRSIYLLENCVTPTELKMPLTCIFFMADVCCWIVRLCNSKYTAKCEALMKTRSPWPRHLTNTQTTTTPQKTIYNSLTSQILAHKALSDNLRLVKGFRPMHGPT